MTDDSALRPGDWANFPDLWSSWSGGDMPTSPEQSVQIMLRSGRQLHGRAKHFEWAHRGNGYGSDVVAYYLD